MQLRTGGALEIEGESIAAGPLLAEIYERRGFTTAWAPEKIAELIGIIGGIESEGLDPSDYHLEALQRLRVGRQRLVLASTPCFGRQDTFFQSSTRDPVEIGF